MDADPFAGTVETRRDPVGQTVRVGGVEVCWMRKCPRRWMHGVSPDTLVASSTGLMVKWMVVVEDATWSSVTETLKESDPKKSGLGSRSSFRPQDRWLRIRLQNRGDRKVGPSVRPSASVALRSPEAEVSSAMDAWVSPDTVVASSTGLMVKWMVVVEDAPLVISDGDPEGIGPEEVGGWGSRVQFPFAGSMDADPFAGTEEIEVGTVGQTVRVGGVEVTGGGSVLGDG